MIYGIFRAIIQDLRHSAHYLHILTEKAYLKATSESSQNRKMSYFYGLLSRLLVIKLNTAALKNTNVNLKVFIDAMHDDKSINIPLVSKNAQYMLKDQMGLVDLLAEEIPDFIRQAEAISNLAFNTLTASNNRFLKPVEYGLSELACEQLPTEHHPWDDIRGDRSRFASVLSLALSASSWQGQDLG